MSTVSILDVAIDARTGGRDAVYSYRDPGGYEVGQGVLVPLGPRSVLGFVVKKRDVAPEDFEFPLWNLKPPSRLIDGLKLPEQVIRLLEFISREYLCSMSAALLPAIPPGCKDRLVTTWALTGIQPPVGEKLSVAQQEALRVIVAQGGKLLERKTAPLTVAVKRTLRVLKEKGYVSEVLSMSLVADKHRLVGRLRLTSDSDRVEGFLSGPGRKRPAQTHVLMQMQGSESTSFESSEVKALSGATDQTLRALIQAGLLEKVDDDTVIPRPPPTPNPQQMECITEINKSVVGRIADTFLLYGVTGSGKTEVFLRCASEALRQGRQVLYLVPEISLTPQVIAKLRERFGKSVAILHSNMTPGERLQNWARAANGEAAVVLGPRSALFAPLDNLGLIILDEEHESSYKQEQVPRYHARTAARFLAGQHQCPVVLGSATPSIESAYAAELGEYKFLRMPYRAASAQLPTVHIEDLTALYATKRVSLFTESLRNLIVEALHREEQVILFLNRRAYAPFIICRECGHNFMCPHCSVALSYHQRANLLKCHHCDYQERAPDECPACGGLKLGPFGTGTERVEETVRDTFPGVRVARLDRDVVQKKGVLEETLALFRTGEIDILVGTQMVAKGLDFPHVTVVGVIAADISLNIPDFRASERTFQLLSQVAGRAGRGTRPGEVVIQTLNPTNDAITKAQNHDFHGYYERELAVRKDAGYPPFCKLVNVVFTGPNLADVTSLANAAVMDLRKLIPDAEIRGPVDCPLARLKDLWRIHALVKLDPETPTSFVQEALAGVEIPKDCGISIDVDPYSMA